jgi:hypothetical protein
MSKKILSEAAVRRFATLANLPLINEDWGSEKDEKSKTDSGEKDYTTKKGDKLKQDEPGGRGEKKGDKAFMNEDAFSEIDDEAMEAGEGELDAGEMAGLEDEAGLEGEEEVADLGAREELAMDVIAAVADALNIEVDIEGGEEEEIEDVEMGGEDLGAEEFDMEAEEEIMEALKGIQYIPGKKEIVQEVAKRVAQRLLKAKRAEQQLKEALGTSPPRRRRRPALTKRRRRTK